MSLKDIVYAVIIDQSEGGIARTPTSGYVTLTVNSTAKRIVVGPLYTLENSDVLLASTLITARVRTSSGTTLINNDTYTTNSSGMITIDSGALNQGDANVFFEYITEDGDYIGHQYPVVDIP